VRARFDSKWRQRALSGDREVVQETLVRALKQLEQYEPKRAGDNPFPWLTGLARNEISRVLSRDRRTVSLDALWQRLDNELLVLFEKLESEPLGEELLHREETRELVNVTMSQLPPNYREALQAKYLDGASVRDMAHHGGTTEKAVESLLSRARQAFRATFLSVCRNLRTETP
jgi:RNA polymerase sigma-70 factor, ECF subfamily